MFKIYSNFMPMADFCMPLTGHTNFGLGDPYITEKPISIFNDYTPTFEQLQYNPYNILMITEPNQLFGLHDWALQYGDNFSCILTWSEPLLQKYEVLGLIA